MIRTLQVVWSWEVACPAQRLVNGCVCSFTPTLFSFLFINLWCLSAPAFVIHIAASESHRLLALSITAAYVVLRRRYNLNVWVHLCPHLWLVSENAVPALTMLDLTFMWRHEKPTQSYTMPNIAQVGLTCTIKLTEEYACYQEHQHISTHL